MGQKEGVAMGTLGGAWKRWDQLNVREREAFLRSIAVFTPSPHCRWWEGVHGEKLFREAASTNDFWELSSPLRAALVRANIGGEFSVEEYQRRTTGW